MLSSPQCMFFKEILIPPRASKCEVGTDGEISVSSKDSHSFNFLCGVKNPGIEESGDCCAKQGSPEESPTSLILSPHKGTPPYTRHLRDIPTCYC